MTNTLIIHQWLESQLRGADARLRAADLARALPIEDAEEFDRVCCERRRAFEDGEALRRVGEILGRE